MDLQARIKEAFKVASTDKHHTHEYERYYAQVFEKTPESLLEIGIYTGRSMAAWRTLFPDVDLYGVDITTAKFEKEVLEYANSKNIIGDSTKPDILTQFDRKTFDVIIDDGSHYYKNIMKTFDVFKDSFLSYYVIEDAMHKEDEIMDFIRSNGFTNVTKHPSKLKNAPVFKNFVDDNTNVRAGEEILVNLYMIIVKR